MRRKSIRRLVLAALCLALGMLLPFLTGQIPQIGSALAPMHLPVLLCGFICGGPYGLAVGLISPLLRFTLFGMPPLFPTGMAMSFELAAYGLSAGLLYRMFPKKTGYIYLSLIISMLFGRCVWGTSMAVLLGVSGSAFTWSAFMAGAFVNALPGIIAQIILVPVLVLAFKKAEVGND